MFSLCLLAGLRKTRNSAIADKPRDAFRGQSRSPNMVLFHVISMVSFYCAIITLSLRQYWDIRLQICRDHENRARVRQGHWKCHHSIERMTSY